MSNQATNTDHFLRDREREREQKKIRKREII